MEHNLLIGTGVSLVAAAAASLGVNLQASALVKQRSLHSRQEQSVLEEVGLINCYSQDSAAASPEAAQLSLPNSPHASTPASSPSSSTFGESLILSIQWYTGFSLYLASQVSGSGISSMFSHHL